MILPEWRQYYVLMTQRAINVLGQGYPEASMTFECDDMLKGFSRYLRASFPWLIVDRTMLCPDNTVLAFVRAIDEARN